MTVGRHEQRKRCDHAIPRVGAQRDRSDATVAENSDARRVASRTCTAAMRRSRTQRPNDCCVGNRSGDTMRGGGGGHSATARTRLVSVPCAVLAAVGVPLTSGAAAAPPQDPFDQICSKGGLPSARHDLPGGPRRPVPRPTRQVIGSRNRITSSREPLWSALRSFDPLLALGPSTHSPSTCSSTTSPSDRARRVLGPGRRALRPAPHPAAAGLAGGFGSLSWNMRASRCSTSRRSTSGTCLTFVQCLQQVKA